jgi:hypothetical protein
MVFPGGKGLLLYGVCAEVRNVYGVCTECVRKCTECVRNVYGMCISPSGRNSPGWSMTPPGWGMMIFPSREGPPRCLNGVTVSPCGETLPG